MFLSFEFSYYFVNFGNVHFFIMINSKKCALSLDTASDRLNQIISLNTSLVCSTFFPPTISFCLINQLFQFPGELKPNLLLKIITFEPLLQIQKYISKSNPKSKNHTKPTINCQSRKGTKEIKAKKNI